MQWEVFTPELETVRVVVCGSRGFTDYERLCTELDLLFGSNTKRVIVISGHAQGADMLGERYAHERELTCDVYPAEWDTYGKCAGFLRNSVMAQKCNAAVLFWDGKSKGTKQMMAEMIKVGKPYRVISV